MSSSSSPRRRTSHTPTRRAAALALVGVSALIAGAVQSGAATAAPVKAPQAAGQAIPGSESVRLTPAQRAELIRGANADKAATAKELGLGAQEAQHQPQDDVRVLLDPAGHPFCLYVDAES